MARPGGTGIEGGPEHGGVPARRRRRLIGGERVGAILAAGGSGQRAGVAKQWVDAGRRDGAPPRGARCWPACGVVDEMVAVVPPARRPAARPSCWPASVPVRAVAGGAARADSVRARARRRWARCAVVLVHDAARPFATAGAGAGRGRGGRGARRGAGGPAGHRHREAGRDGRAGSPRPSTGAVLWLAQTPQGFRATCCSAGPSPRPGAAAAAATDECQLVERLGAPVTLVPGEPGNFKITGAGRPGPGPGAPRAAGGHRRGLRRATPSRPGRKLVLGGVEFEGDGLLGHSDADICAHAICDAILGAAGLGDIGRHFPDTDPRWKGVSSLHLLREVAGKARGAGLGGRQLRRDAGGPAPEDRAARRRDAGPAGRGAGRLARRRST